MTRTNAFGAILIVSFVCACSGGLVSALGVCVGMIVSGAIIAASPVRDDASASWDSAPPPLR